MLTAETKRKIDNLRDTLVGKLPVPTQQVEQITLALIYKFMSDIDEENAGIGGKSFFNSAYKKYSWRHIMDRSLPGHERVALYADGLEKMSLNRNLPQLFRDIFKGAYLPFKDPIVVDHFLKGVNELKYDHSEELGNAFEYLLSIMGSQGDAGQFRTPRHIIDFIVKAIDPQKEDKILDPACGTAGFLISAYKHILAQNTDLKTKRPGSLLSTTERRKLTKNFVGYDISHEMVRLSLVNMYLHNFPEPKIYEYDTLSSLDRWDDDFDCILANPPFMTPRGGIRPHNRFAVQARRSEVLFVDYIMEHLTTRGKAGVIVPEGIIFQSGNAYKALRKMLVDGWYLFAVVSLPQGVFNPYSGVKTSILLMDKTIAKAAEDILFIKITSDGYDLGAQRRPLGHEGDFPIALHVLRLWQDTLRSGGNKVKLKGKKEWEHALWVPKGKIAESGDYNLSADRYRVATDYTNVKWSITNLGEVCEFIGGYAFKSDELKNEKTDENDKLVIKIGNVNKNGELDIDGAQYSACNNSLSKFLIHDGDILVAMTGATVGKVAVSQFDDLLLNQRVGLIKADENKISKQFLKFILLSEKFYKFCQIQAGGGAQGNISPDQIKSYKIPLPPLEIQKEIVAELESYQKIFNGAKQIVDNYKPTIKLDPSWKTVELEVLADTFIDGNWIESKDQSKGGIRLVQTGNVGFGEYLDKGGHARYISEETFKRLKCVEVKPGDILISRLPDPIGRACIVPELKIKLITAVDCTIVRFDPAKMLSVFFIAYAMTSDYYRQLNQFLTGASRKRISRGNLGKIKIPVPPFADQKKIVAQFEQEQKQIGSVREVADLFEQKIKDKIAEVW